MNPDFLARCQMHLLGNGCEFLTGQLPDALIWDAARFERIWDLHPAERHKIMIYGRWVETPRWQQAYGADSPDRVVFSWSIVRGWQGQAGRPDGRSGKLRFWQRRADHSATTWLALPQWRLPKMSQQSQIEWTDATWNPVRGCTQITPGCTNCYAKTFAERFRGVPGHPYEQGFDLRLVPAKLEDPLQWKTPKMIFANSMSDLFHEEVPNDFICSVVRVMQSANWHTYQVLTKRSERLQEMLQTKLVAAGAEPHIWWGVSVENRKHGLPRVDHLRAAPACVRFLSIEPLLEDLGEINLEGIHWVIVGGESGARSRPMPKEWVLSVRDQCERAKVPFFFKQWGGRQKHKTGRLLEGRTYDEFPPVVRNPVPDKAVRMEMIDEVKRLWPKA